MKRTPPGNIRVGRGLALAALCAAALTACGTEGAGSGAPAAAPSAVTQAPAPSQTPTGPAPDPADDPRRTPEEQAAELRFMQLVIEVAAPCTEGLPTVPPPMEPDGPPPPTDRPSEELPVADTAPPSSKPWDFERARQETDLGGVEKCAAPLHGKRIAKALDGKATPNPADVEKILHGIGYDLDYRLDGPRKANGKVEFTLDLRSMGGELCLSGSYDGTRTSFDPYGASPEVRCQDVKRRA